jgi:hypothetical protein
MWATCNNNNNKSAYSHHTLHTVHSCSALENTVRSLIKLNATVPYRNSALFLWLTAKHCKVSPSQLSLCKNNKINLHIIISSLEQRSDSCVQVYQWTHCTLDTCHTKKLGTQTWLIMSMGWNLGLRTVSTNGPIVHLRVICERGLSWWKWWPLGKTRDSSTRALC